jgi:hypothetical protein
VTQVLNNVKPKQGEDGFGSFAGKRTGEKLPVCFQ